MKDHFYKLKSYKKDGPLIAEIKVHKGQAILAFDKLNIFDNKQYEYTHTNRGRYC